MINRIIKFISNNKFLLLALAIGGGYYAYPGVKRLLNSWEAPQQVIQEPNGMYNGAFVNYYVDLAHIACFEKMSGQKLDFIKRHINFRGLSSGDAFPAIEANLRTLYLVLEPGSGRRGVDNTYPPQKLLAGSYNAQLEAFAEGALDFCGPIFVTFRPSLSTGYAPELIKRAYIYTHDKVVSEGATNITWVWSVNLDDPDFVAHYPGNNYVNWISVTIYQPEQLAKLERNIGQLKSFGKPIMVEFGSDAAPSQKAEFLRKVIAKLKELGVKAFILDNVSRLEGGVLRSWSLQTEEERAAYQGALARQEQFLRENIITRGGELAGGESVSTENFDCAEIETSYQDAARGKQIEQFHEVHESFSRIHQLAEYAYFQSENWLLLKAAEQSLHIYYVSGGDPRFLKEAEEHLKTALQNANTDISFDTYRFSTSDIFSPTIHPVEAYFELKLALLNLQIITNPAEALSLAEEIESELNNQRLVKAQGMDQESVPGYENRLKLMEGDIYFQQRNYSRAYELYAEVDEWASGEQGRSWLQHGLVGENQRNLRFDATLAKLGLVKIDFYELYRTAPESGRLNVDHIFKRLSEILMWEEAASENGYMDRGFEALINAMELSLLSTENLQQAKDKFRASLPWAQLNETDLNRTLCENCNFLDPQVDLWNTVLDGFENVDLRQDLQLRVDSIRVYTETQSQNHR